MQKTTKPSWRSWKSKEAEPLELHKKKGVLLCRTRETQSGRLLTVVLTLLMYAAVMVTASFGLRAVVIPAAVMGLVFAAWELWGPKKYFYHGVLGLLLIAALGGKWTADGFCRIWNSVADTFTRYRAIPLMSMKTVTDNGTLSLGFASVVLGGAVYLLSGLAVRRARTAAAVILPLTGTALLVIFGIPGFPIWLAGLFAVSLILLAAPGEYQKGRGAALTGSMAICFGAAALLLGIFAASGSGLWMEHLRDDTRDFCHRLRYETKLTALPEGDFRDFDPSAQEEYTALMVTMEKPEPLFLRGFTADTFQNDRWLPVTPEALAEEKEMLYWLYKEGFYPQSQFASAAGRLNLETNQIRIQNVNACRKYAYTPYSLVTSKAMLDTGTLRSGWVDGKNAEDYSYQTVFAPESQLEAILERLDTLDDPEVQAFRQAESAYRAFVRKTDLQVPDSILETLGPAMDAGCSAYGPADRLTLAQAQSSALLFLTRCFGENAEKTALPLSKLGGTQYQYATVACMVLRYYGVPARYAEGYVITKDMAKQSSVTVGSGCGRAWVEIYQEGVGWMPLELTPGFEALAGKETEAGIQPVGVSGLDPDSDIGSVEGSGDSTILKEGKEQQEEDAEKNDTSGPLSKGGTVMLLRKLFKWTLLTVPVLLLLALILVVVRKFRRDRQRKERFHGESCADSVGWIFAESAALLEELGLSRGTGSMEAVCDRAGEKFGPEFGILAHKMRYYNNLALFSGRPLTADQREEMLGFYDQVVDYVRKTVSWYRKLWLVWGLCRY